MDVPEVYPDTLTNAQILWLYQNPGGKLKRTGDDPTPPQPDPDPDESNFTVYADSFQAYNFEGWTLGEFTTLDVQQNFIGATHVYIPTHDGMYPDIINVDAKSNGDASRVFRSWNWDGIYASTEMFNGHRIWFPIFQAGLDEVYVSYNILFPTGWAMQTTNTLWSELKMPGLASTYFVNILKGTDSFDEATQTWSGAGTSMSTLTKSPRYEPVKNRLTALFWWNSNPDVTDGDPYAFTGGGFDDPETGSMFDFETNIWYNITLRLNTGTPYGYDGFIEVYINGRLSFQMMNMNFKTSDWDITYCKFQQYWTSQLAGAPTGDWGILFDDLYIFRYKSTFEGYVDGPAPLGTSLLLPNWDTEAGTKK